METVNLQIVKACIDLGYKSITKIFECKYCEKKFIICNYTGCKSKKITCERCGAVTIEQFK